MRIRIRFRIQLINFDADPVSDPDSNFLFDADPDPTFHYAANPDPDRSFKKRLKPLKSAKIGAYSIHFGLTSANFDADSDPVPDPAYTF
jgi:hypothetical protein